MLAKVIVDLPVWGLNRELTYLVPGKLEDLISVGSVVRVPLRGRRVRGWVVGLSTSIEDDEPGELVPLAQVSGRAPVFDDCLLGMARALARRYVHPLSSFLSLFTPPRLGRPSATTRIRPSSPHDRSADTRPVAGRRMLRLLPSDEPVGRYASEIERQLERGMGAIVVVPQVREGSSVLHRLAERFPDDAAVVHSGLQPAERAKALWSVAEGVRRVVLGGRAAVFAPPFPVGMIVIHQEHEASLKDDRSPYYDARVVAGLRAEATGSSLLFASQTPSLSCLLSSQAQQWAVEEPSRAEERLTWPLVEVVEPARRRIPKRAIASIVQACARGERVIVLTPRVSLTPSGPGVAELAALLARVVPEARITRADRPSLGPHAGALKEALEGDVVIATEAALADVERPPAAVAIALGVDSFLQRPWGRASEETFKTLWSLGALVAGSHPKGRVMIETGNPDHYVIQALTRGDYRYFARREMELRRMAGAPPFSTLVKVEADARPSSYIVEQLELLPGTLVLGPSPGGRLGWQILLKVEQLEAILDPLNQMVASSSERLRVEVDVKDW